jgi:hypothetical protein
VQGPFWPLEHAAKQSLKVAVTSVKLPGYVSLPQLMRYCTPHESNTVWPSLLGQLAVDAWFVETATAGDVVVASNVVEDIVNSVLEE